MRKICLVLLFSCQTALAQNPIIQTIYTADPAPIVHEDTLFLYVGHNEDHAPDNSFLMREYSLFATTDMVNCDDWKTLETEVRNIFGIQDLYLIFNGREPMELFRFDYWMFGKKTE